jgi:hypothetical protein
MSPVEHVIIFNKPLIRQNVSEVRKGFSVISEFIANIKRIISYVIVLKSRRLSCRWTKHLDLVALNGDVIG